MSRRKNNRRRLKPKPQARLCSTPDCGRITLQSTCTRCREKDAERMALEAIATAAKVSA